MLSSRAPCSPGVQDFANETRPLESYKIILSCRPSSRGAHVQVLGSQNRIGIDEQLRTVTVAATQ